MDGDGAPVVIDNDTLTLDFVVADNIRLEHVSVRLDFASNFPDDVELFLESPNGTRIQLVADEGGGTDFDGVWSFGATGFRGELSAGEWTVIIVDDAGADPTTIRDVKLDLSGAAVSDDDLFIFTDEYSNYGGITHSLIHDGGAAGIDTINAAAVSSASDIDLQAGIGVIDFVLVTVSDIENVYTGDGDDQVKGDGGDNLISGGRGDDLLNGRGGDDILMGGLGADTLHGNNGSDTASYADATSAVTVRLYDGFTAGVYAAGDLLISIENLTGSDHHDTLYGDSGANTLDGGAGNDFLQAGRGDDVVRGGAGKDTLYGHDGADLLEGGNQADDLYGGDDNDILRGGFGVDSLYGEAGDDTLDGGVAADTLDGGAGRDTASYASSSAGVTARLYDGFTAGGDAEGDTLISIENLTGSDHDDILYGDSGANTLEGGAGDDLLNAGRGNDVIRGGAGQDVLAGHDGNDFLDGGAQADQLYGGDGNDALRGGFGGDSLFGQAGDDTLDGGAWSDTLDGGAGDDTAIYANSTAGVTVRLYDGFADGGDASGDTLISIENLTGSNHDDILYGDSGANTLEGGAGDDFLNAGRGNDVVRGGDGQDALYGHDGNDFLDGGAQADQLYGGDGNDALRGGFGGDSLFGQAGDDTLDGGAWSDTLDGGAGRDTASYANSSAGVTARLYDGFTAGGDAEGDTLISIENLTGSDHDDILYGDSRANTLEGGAGDDFLNAGRGDDIVLGGVGQDALYGHDGNDFLDGGAQADQLYGGDGNDTLIGGFGGDSLFGQAGDDTLEGGGWSDTLDGGAGFDRAIFSGLQSDYAFSTDAITGELIVEDLRPGSPDGTDRLTDIEELEFGDGSVVAVGALGGASELSVSSLEAGFIYQPSEGAASPTALGQPVKAEPFSWADYDAINPAQFGVSKIIEAEVFEVWAGDGDAVVYEAAHQPVPVSAPEAMDPVILGSLHGDPALRFSDTLDLSVHNAPNVLNGVDRGDGLLRVDVLDDVWAS